MQFLTSCNRVVLFNQQLELHSVKPIFRTSFQARSPLPTRPNWTLHHQESQLFTLTARVPGKVGTHVVSFSICTFLLPMAPGCSQSEGTSLIPRLPSILSACGRRLGTLGAWPGSTQLVHTHHCYTLMINLLFWIYWSGLRRNDTMFSYVIVSYVSPDLA